MAIPAWQLLASVESRYRWKRSSELRRLVNSETIGPRIVARFRGAIREGPLKVRGGEEIRGPRGKGRGAIFSAAVENVITRIRAAGERGREVTTARLGKDNAGIYISATIIASSLPGRLPAYLLALLALHSVVDESERAHSYPLSFASRAHFFSLSLFIPRARSVGSSLQRLCSCETG